MTVEFDLLGDVELRIDGGLINVGHARQRCVLLALLVDANQTVSADQMVDRVWGEHRLPARPFNALHTYISLLRRVLAPAPEVAIERRPGGYRLAVDVEAVDLHRFHGLIDHARASVDDESAARLYEQALALWRGEPFASLDTAWLDLIRATLQKERHAVQLDLTDIRLRGGQHGALLADLSGRAAGRPLDERLSGQLMLALYRSGRQADALEEYRQIRRRLAEELGTDPGAPLKALHQRILAADPELDAPASRSEPGPARPEPARLVLPHQLPAPPRLFTGRARELDHLNAALDEREQPGGTVVISAIGGSGGIGKTWLALHWAHRNLHLFPDGQLHVDLRGFDPSGSPMQAAVALRGFLDALGVNPATVPRDLDAQAGLYRSLLAGKRMLIVLDNARDAAQVIPLLPGSPTCTVLVTSRRRMTGLVTAHGARSVNMDVLTEPDARELLIRHLGTDEVAGAPDAVAEILTCCAGMPLAIGVVAARAAAHPHLPLTALAEELRLASARLDALDGGDPTANVRAVISWSYDALGNEAATMFELLGIAPGADIALTAAASLAALPVTRTRALLRELEDAHMVTQHEVDRYRMHDLLRLYADDRARHGRPPPSRDPALWRLLDFYLHTAHAGDRLLEPHRPPVDLDRLANGCRPVRLQDQASALAWFDSEHRCLLAAQQMASDQGRDRAVWQLAWTLDTFQRWRGHLDDNLAVWRAGIRAARRTGDPAARGLAHWHLGRATSQVGGHIEALDHLGHALTAAELNHDPTAEAHAHRALAAAWEQQGNDQRALVHAARALRLFQGLGNPTWVGMALNQTGWCLSRLGHYQLAGAHCEQALTLFRDLEDRVGEAVTLDSLGYIAHRTGRHARALDHYLEALALQQALGNTYWCAGILDHIGQVHAARGHLADALSSWQQALALYRAQRRTHDAERLRRQIGSLGGSGPAQETSPHSDLAKETPRK